MVLYSFSLHVFKLLIYPTVILFLNSVGTGDNFLSVLKFTEGFSGLNNEKFTSSSEEQ